MGFYNIKSLINIFPDDTASRNFINQFLGYCARENQSRNVLIDLKLTRNSTKLETVAVEPEPKEQSGLIIGTKSVVSVVYWFSLYLNLNGFAITRTTNIAEIKTYSKISKMPRPIIFRGLLFRITYQG